MKTLEQHQQEVALQAVTLKAQRDALLAALDFVYRYFVMPGHAQQAKDCPNKDCPFCKAEAAIRLAESD